MTPPHFDRLFFMLGCISAAISVAAGAFGAHGLKNVLTSDMLEVYETAVRYQMYHAFGLIVVALTTAIATSRGIKMAGWLFAAGTVLFSGSLYVLTLTNMKWLGAVTPLGGLAFIAGWLFLAFSIVTKRP